jgi:hypothetical protein
MNARTFASVSPRCADAWNEGSLPSESKTSVALHCKGSYARRLGFGLAQIPNGPAGANQLGYRRSNSSLHSYLLSLIQAGL